MIRFNGGEHPFISTVQVPHQPNYRSLFAFCSAPQFALPFSYLTYAAECIPWCQRINRRQQISASFLALATRAILALERWRIRVEKFAKATSACTIFVAASIKACRGNNSDRGTADGAPAKI